MNNDKMTFMTTDANTTNGGIDIESNSTTTYVTTVALNLLESRLDGRCDAIQTTTESQYKQMSRLNSLLGVATLTLKSLENKVNEYSTKINTAESLIKTVQLQLTEKQLKLNELTDLINAYEAITASGHTKISELLTLMEATKTDIENCLTNLTTAKNDLTNAKTDFETAKHALNEAKDNQTLARAKFDEAKALADAANEKYEAAEGCGAKIDEFNSNWQLAESVMLNLKADNNTANEYIGLLDGLNTLATSNVETLNETITAAESKKTELTNFTNTCKANVEGVGDAQVARVAQAGNELILNIQNQTNSFTVGDGLQKDNLNVLTVKAGAGIKVDLNGVSVNQSSIAGDGLEPGNAVCGEIKVKAANNSINVSKDGIKVDADFLCGRGLVSPSGNEININIADSSISNTDNGIKVNLNEIAGDGLMVVANKLTLNTNSGGGTTYTGDGDTIEISNNNIIKVKDEVFAAYSHDHLINWTSTNLLGLKKEHSVKLVDGVKTKSGKVLKVTTNNSLQTTSSRMLASSEGESSIDSIDISYEPQTAEIELIHNDTLSETDDGLGVNLKTLTIKVPGKDDIVYDGKTDVDVEFGATGNATNVFDDMQQLDDYDISLEFGLKTNIGSYLVDVNTSDGTKLGKYNLNIELPSVTSEIENYITSNNIGQSNCDCDLTDVLKRGDIDVDVNFDEDTKELEVIIDADGVEESDSVTLTCFEPVGLSLTTSEMIENMIATLIQNGNLVYHDELENLVYHDEIDSYLTDTDTIKSTLVDVQSQITDPTTGNSALATNYQELQQNYNALLEKVQHLCENLSIDFDDP